MGIWPEQPSRPMLPIISTFGQQMGGIMLAATATPAPNSTSNPFTQFGFAVPLYLRHPYIVDKVWWYNGSAANGNVEFAIYDGDMSQIVTTGSIAVSGASALQASDITDLTLDAGAYYLAINYDGATATYFMSNTVSDRVGQFALVSYYLANTTPLPADLTGQFSGSTRQYPSFGISCRALVT